MQKTSKFRRLLAGLLAVLMLSICIPAAAFAEDDKREIKVTYTYTDENGQPQYAVTDDGDNFDILTLESWQNESANWDYIRTLLNIPEGYSFDDSQVGDVGLQGETLNVKVVKNNEPEISYIPYEYKVAFKNVNGDTVYAATVMGDVLDEGETRTIFDILKTNMETVENMGYVIGKVEMDGTEVKADTILVKGDRDITVNVTEKTVEPEYQDAIYKLNFIDQATGKNFKSFQHNGTVIKGETAYLLSSIDASVQSVLDEGYELVKVEFANGDPVDDTTVMTAGTVDTDKHNLNVYVTAKTAEPEYEDAIYKLNFYDQDGVNFEAFQHNGTIIKGETTYLLAAIEPSLQTVLDQGYELSVVKFSSGDPIDETTVMTAGGVDTDKHNIDVYVVKRTDVEWLDAIYELNFVDQDGNNVESFRHNGTIMKDGETTYLLAALEPSVQTVLDKGYDLRKVEFSSGDPIDETTVMTAGNVETDKHKIVVYVTEKSTASTGNDSTSNTNTTANTTTATASSDDSNDEVVKASAPADNTTKILPQTGNQGVVSPVSFVVVLCAALAGAAVYLFAIRKKLN